MIAELIALLTTGKRRVVLSPTGMFCENCGSPMVSKKGIVLRYDENTGQPIKGDSEAWCSRDKFCGLWGMPGF